MARAIYVLCALTAALCAYLLFRGFERSRARLLLWGGICFLGLAINNLMLVVDRVLLPDADLSIARLIPAVLGICALVVGLIGEND